MYVNIFKTIWDAVNGWLQGLFGLESLINQGLNYFWSLDPVFQILGILFTGVIVIMGVISFIKKIFKLFIAIVVIFVIYLIVKATL